MLPHFIDISNETLQSWPIRVNNLHAKMRVQKDPIIDMSEAVVRDAEQRVSRQVQIIARLEADGYHDTARRARELLASLNETLQIARRNLDVERRRLGPRLT
jgi:hypothetical protein